MKRLYLNLVLLLALCALGTAVWLAQEKDIKGLPLTALKQSDVSRISIQHRGKPELKLEKKDGQWHLTAPVQAPADKFEVNGILALADLEVASHFTSEVNLAELNLAPPKYSVTLNDTRIDLGGTEPIKFRRYVASGDVLGLIDDPPSAALDEDYSDLIAKNIVPEGAELARIALPGKLRLERDGDGKWIRADAGDARPEQLSDLAESWRNARAMWNAAETEENPESDAETVQLTLNNGEEIHLVVHAREPQLILSRPDLKLRYTLSKSLASDLLQLPVEKPDAAEPESEPDAAREAKLPPTTAS